MHYYTEQVKLIKQIYPEYNKKIYATIKLNTTTRISEMIPRYQKYITNNKNRMIENRIFLPKANGQYQRNQNRMCPMRYDKVLCHACYQEILPHYLYLSKNGEHGRSKFYHLTCAEEKHILILDSE